MLIPATADEDAAHTGAAENVAHIGAADDLLLA